MRRLWTKKDVELLRRIPECALKGSDETAGQDVVLNSKQGSGNRD